MQTATLPPPSVGDIVLCAAPTGSGPIAGGDVRAVPGIVVSVSRPDYKGFMIDVYIFCGHDDLYAGMGRRQWVETPRAGFYCWPRPV